MSQCGGNSAMSQADAAIATPASDVDSGTPEMEQVDGVKARLSWLHSHDKELLEVIERATQQTGSGQIGSNGQNEVK